MKTLEEKQNDIIEMIDDLKKVYHNLEGISFLLGISPSTIGCWYRKQRFPDMKNFKKLQALWAEDAL